MDRGELLLQDLKNKLLLWVHYIKRCTHAAEVVFEPGTKGEFTVVTRWEKPTAGSYRKEFTRPYVFGGTYTLSSLAWAVERRACDHARDVVREVLSHRGVL